MLLAHKQIKCVPILNGGLSRKFAGKTFSIVDISNFDWFLWVFFVHNLNLQQPLTDLMTIIKGILLIMEHTQII